jgi:spermidine/putrescine transport system ATP-binding protein
LIAGFESPDQGAIHIDDRPMAEVPPHRRPVNLVFQSYALFPHLTVQQNVAFGPTMAGLSREEIRLRVRNALDMVKLSGKEDRLPGQLSGGEQQRVALARALINRPAVLLLDEPLSALDQQLRQDMQGELKAIQERVGITFVCVTHHQKEAMALSDRIAVMHQGRVLQIGSPAEIYNNPASVFVAQFVGASNELRGTLVDRASAKGGVLQALDLDHAQDLRVNVTEDSTQHTMQTLVVRPERIHLSTSLASPAFDNQLQGRVEKVFYMGSDLQYIVRLSQAVQWTVQVPWRSDMEKPWPIGTDVFVQWQTGDGVLLPS